LRSLGNAEAAAFAARYFKTGDREDLIHKSAGWMLREVGKRDRAVLEGFLGRHGRIMPRTMLRYAIERLPDEKRKAILSGEFFA
jgi:3-methyladenine DNA glycosylase AlkD